MKGKMREWKRPVCGLRVGALNWWVPFLNHNTISKALPRDFLSRWSFSHLFSPCRRICQSILKQTRAAWKILLSILFPSQRLTALSRSWSMSNLHVTLVSLPGLSLFHAIYGRLPAIQPCHWQGLAPVTYANETNKQKKSCTKLHLGQVWRENLGQLFLGTDECQEF